MEQNKNLFENSHRNGLGSLPGRRILTVEVRFDHLQVPVAVFVPDELVEHMRVLIEMVPLDRFPDLADDPLQAAEQPAVHEFFGLAGQFRDLR